MGKLTRTLCRFICLRSMALWLVGFLSVNVVLEGLEVFTMLYESEESWSIVSQLISQHIGFSYLGIQFILGSLVPLFILGGVEIIGLAAREKTALRIVVLALVLIGVFAMCWNVVEVIFMERYRA